MKVLNKLQILSKPIEKQKSFMILILESKYAKNSFNGKILGLTLAEWVKFACEDSVAKIKKFDEKSNVLEFAKKHIDNAFDYTIILSSKTPLITNDTIRNIMEYSVYKDVSLCKLPVGYVINNNRITDNIQVDSIYSQNIDDFYVVESKVQFNYALKILQDRINNFHTQNGVELISPDKVYIEPFVDIEKDVVIYPNNSIKGKAVIGKNVILKENNVIENSRIGENSCISGSVITDSVIASNVYISAFCEINNSLIGNDSIIERNVGVHNYSVDAGSKIKANITLGATNDSDSGAR